MPDENTRPAPPAGENVLWYRGWECRFDWQSEYWTGRGWSAYFGGADLDCIQITAGTWNELLDEIDEHELTPDAIGKRRDKEKK